MKIEINIILDKGFGAIDPSNSKPWAAPEFSHVLLGR